MGPRLSFRHYLDEERPAREFTGLDRIEKIAAMAFAVLRNESFRFRVGEICNPLLAAKMEFAAADVLRRVNHRTGVAAEEVHKAEAVRNAGVRHHERDLVQRLGQ